MAVSIRIEPESGVAIATCSGPLNARVAQAGATALWNMPDWPGRAAVWDFREAEFDLSTSDIRQVARFIFSHQPDPPPARVAFVTGRDVDFGLARMFEVFREDSRTVFHVFRDSDEAVAWARSADAPGT